MRNVAATLAIAVTALAGASVTADAAGASSDAQAQATNVDGRTIQESAPLEHSLFDFVQPASSPEESELGVACFNGRTDGNRNVYLTCDSHTYPVYVDCTDGRHEFRRSYTGRWDFRLTCPEGTRAVSGGSWFGHA
ncbi:hypothetical protein [Streptomyces guryensis]|uniref:Secreted protein n=1 Tax=Streptomyces guryensis TaxID=2886947 RepID=A0A9Q3VMD8_9ACTN|nr:hypothetical protein [Streptomyces guryensis]MCD9874966.1 hypothetical protein [Streptomyces guryensis]